MSRYVNEHDAPPHVICRRCMTTLDTIGHNDGRPLEYAHAFAVSRVIGNTDHDVDPVLFDPSTMELVGVCDFCSTAGPRWRYPATTFVEMISGYGSVDDWAACTTCHDLIETGDDRSCRRLVDRALARFPEAVRRAMRPGIAEFHDQFRSHRNGEAVAQW